MKYQGFYDSAYSAAGIPDREFTAKQFCAHLKGLIGNGIGLTKATGDNAWKIEKMEDLKIKIILGDNNYNFASLNGNPFAVDEELYFDISEGTDRWDAVIIRADATSEKRTTDVKVQEGSVDIIRDTDIYDLRLARIHIVDNVITEIIDDRLDNEYCGIANGLTTVPTDELIELLNNVANGELVALKNGTLQKNLNAEMVGGNTLAEIMEKIFVTGSFEISTTTQTIDLGFTPRCIIIDSGATRAGTSMSSETAIVTTEKPTYIYSNSSGTSTILLQIVENGFEITGQSGMFDAAEYGTGYRYIAFR